MENRLNPAGEGKSQKKEWYKNWWGVIIALMIWPLFAWWYIIKKAQWSDEKKGFAIIGVIILTVIMFKSVGSSDSKDRTVVQKDETKQVQQTADTKAPTQEVKSETPPANTVENTPQIVETAQQQEIQIPKYEIIHEVSGKRYDGAKIYYVLIDPVKLSDASFKDDVKAIINNITKEKGAKISVIIYDKKSSLESSYDEASYQKIPTQKEKTEGEIHNVAIFSGELKTDIYLNTLSFFPATFRDNKTVGKYLETIEFNPSQV